jgi:hypothetical protein
MAIFAAQTAVDGLGAGEQCGIMSPAMEALGQSNGRCQMSTGSSAGNQKMSHFPIKPSSTVSPMKIFRYFVKIFPLDGGELGKNLWSPIFFLRAGQIFLKWPHVRGSPPWFSFPTS